MRAIYLTLLALATLPNYAECAGRFFAHRHPARNVVRHVATCKPLLQVRCVCHEKGKCECLNCCCDSRRLVQTAVAVVTAPVVVPVRIAGRVLDRAACNGNCCK